MAFTAKSFFLAVILALIPLNSVLCLLQETVRYLRKRRILTGKAADLSPELFDETVKLSPSSFKELEPRLAAGGYRTLRSDNSLAAWRGVGSFPVRVLFFIGTFCLFAGILISTTTRTAQRQMVIEGEPLSTPKGFGGRVERIALADSSGSILSRTLTIEVAPSGAGSGK
jgi:hypothetical protein